LFKSPQNLLDTTAREQASEFGGVGVASRDLKKKCRRPLDAIKKSRSKSE
jgi:hypothetical protein